MGNRCFNFSLLLVYNYEYTEVYRVYILKKNVSKLHYSIYVQIHKPQTGPQLFENIKFQIQPSDSQTAQQYNSTTIAPQLILKLVAAELLKKKHSSRVGRILQKIENLWHALVDNYSTSENSDSSKDESFYYVTQSESNIKCTLGAEAQSIASRSTQKTLPQAIQQDVGAQRLLMGSSIQTVCRLCGWE